MKFRLLLLVVGLSACLTSFSQETNAPAFGKGIFNLVGKDSTWSMKIAARMQFLSVIGWEENSNGAFADPQSNFSVRRARLKFNGFAHTTKLRYKLELGLSNRDLSGASEFTGNAPRYILDALVMWNFYQNFELWVGQTKLPGNLERTISSGDLQLVDRSLLNSNFTLDRDVGLQLRHHFNIANTFVVREILSMAQGEGRNITSGNLGGYQYTGRLEFLPFGNFQGRGDHRGADLEREEKPKLMVGWSYDSNQNAVKTRGNQGSYMVNDAGFYKTNITTVFWDAMFKYNGFSFMGEYASRKAADPIAKNSDGSPTGDVVQIGNGVNLQTGFVLKSNWEFSGRFTSINLDENITGRNAENQYTLGISKYIVGHKLKVQSDFSYLSVKNRANGLMFRIQLDIHF